MKREELYENIDKQILHEKLYRHKIRAKYNHYFKRKKEQYLAEKIIRKKIQRIIEAKKQVRYDNTGLNVLDDLFMNTNLLSTLETEYNSLTTSEKQRVDFKNHIINSIVNLFKIEDAAGARKGPEKEEETLAESLRRLLSEQDIDVEVGDEEPDISITVSDDDIPVVGPKAREEKEDEEEDENKEPEGEPSDDTGIHKAKVAFDKVKKNITDYYISLGNPDDRKNFKVYIVANLELYFKTWEEEDQDNIEAPSNPDIEAAVARGEEAMGEGGEEEAETEEL
tara:strand:+ start:4378 stop:5220 length:843 start_codon:yes stop_codon:yes gene_type:complete